MQQRFLGATGLSVSRLGLGTMTWGRDTDEHEAREQLVAFVEAGGTLVDTAAGYTDGDSERLVGSLVGDVCGRDEVVLATKAGVGRRGKERFTNASRGHLVGSLDASIKRLGVDHVDLWQVHTWVDDAPLEETLTALDHAVTSGRAAYVGVSNYNGWQSAQAATWQRAVPGRATLASNQVEYSLLNRAVEAEVVPAAVALGLGILPWSPLGRGVLTGKYRGGTPADSRAASPHFATFVGRYLDEHSQRVVEAVVRAAEGLGWSSLEVALAWVRDRPGVTAPILGARTAAQLREALTVEECTLPDEIVRALDDVSAGEEVPLVTSAKARRFEQRALRPGVEYEYDHLLISRGALRNAVTRMLVERAERGGWEVDRLRLSPDGTRRVQLRRRIIRQRIAFLV